GQTRLWELSRRVSAQWRTQSKEIHQVAFRPDGAAFATIDAEGCARLWESATGLPIGQPLSSRSAVECLVFPPDGALVATGGSDGAVQSFCAFTGLSVGPILEHAGAIHAIVYSNDGRRLATGGAEAMVRCWQSVRPIDGDVERIGCWVRVTTNLEFDAGD